MNESPLGFLNVGVSCPFIFLRHSVIPSAAIRSRYSRLPRGPPLHASNVSERLKKSPPRTQKPWCRFMERKEAHRRSATHTSGFSVSFTELTSTPAILAFSTGQAGL